MKDSVLDIADKIVLGPAHVILESTLYTFALFLETVWLYVTGKGRLIEVDDIHHYFLRLVTTVVSCLVALIVGAYLPWWAYFIAGVFTLIWEDVLTDVFLVIETYLNNHDVQLDVLKVMEVVETSIVTCILTAIVMGTAHK
jgi:hypothetical protein